MRVLRKRKEVQAGDAASCIQFLAEGSLLHYMFNYRSDAVRL